MGDYNDRYRVLVNETIEYGMSSALSFIYETVLSYMEYDNDNKLVMENTIKVIEEKKLNNIINLQLTRAKELHNGFKRLSEFTKNLKNQLDDYIDAHE